MELKPQYLQKPFQDLPEDGLSALFCVSQNIFLCVTLVTVLVTLSYNCLFVSDFLPGSQAL